MLLYDVEMQWVNHNQSIEAKSATYEILYTYLPAGNLCPRNAYFARQLLSVFRPKYATDLLCGACGHPVPVPESASASGDDVCPAIDCGNNTDCKEYKKPVPFRHFSLIAKLRELYLRREYVQAILDHATNREGVDDCISSFDGARHVCKDLLPRQCRH